MPVLAINTYLSLAINTYLGEVNNPGRKAAAPAPAEFDRTVQVIGGRVLAGVDDSPISYLAVDHAAAEAAVVLARHRRGTPAGGLLAATLQVLPRRGHCPVFLVG
ncbi:hypothetical protein [Actinoplanes couchii]|uniref:Uncharacterized protein n=1 Tax=Actinoplanes couchii TaxID=403638 RepID=A0ABQ3XE99_9ACTN|nr:hypothetical protein [Actinoplanes couchii]MDR6317338.1 hypothetical protein [Actinoplanes couchii]GID56831.1 hypothetical protein Aco03nite_052350 [Actinoplanes couchii]